MTKKLSLDEIAERLALPKTTVYYWIKDLPLGRERKWSTGQRKGNAKMQANYRQRREAAYERGVAEFDELVRLPSFRDFVVLYLAEGYKRNRHTASICNSDPSIVAMAAKWMQRLSGKDFSVRVQHHADQEPDALRAFWADTLDVDPSRIGLVPKANSGKLRGRSWRCEHGVAAINVYDTYFRARIGAWMDRLKEAWM